MPAPAQRKLALTEFVRVNVQCPFLIRSEAKETSLPIQAEEPQRIMRLLIRRGLPQETFPAASLRVETAAAWNWLEGVFM